MGSPPSALRPPEPDILSLMLHLQYRNNRAGLRMAAQHVLPPAPHVLTPVFLSTSSRRFAITGPLCLQYPLHRTDLCCQSSQPSVGLHGQVIPCIARGFYLSSASLAGAAQLPRRSCSMRSSLCFLGRHGLHSSFLGHHGLAWQTRQTAPPTHAAAPWRFADFLSTGNPDVM